jgi:hypothetical protein
MSLNYKVPGTVAAAMAAAAIAVPAAGAMPLHESTEFDAGHASTAAAKQSPRQDLRSPDARDAAVLHRGSLAAVKPAGQHQVRLQSPAGGDDGIPWTTIVLGVAGAGLAAGGAAGVARSTRVRARRARVVA